ncbi:hypothetical protein [Borreliella burgdorferi]|uniref:hypothetical protein n=1 Tax=Borreliella burgdorferi TaxID=139 RepID=UPI000D02A6EE|nr:hypothetical protein [Borreliella burgdorferi]MCD2375110.1 hypothetical protein [Borreliella burgdorferi]MCD2386226.1 hypothetical protein [Borreliella burgdorferi]PRR32016.1 hypothetical protein CV693_06020 [Borreliella burgdorferi]PRR35504.1 hypothetical protein CV687_05675 [Borreliella burgdorferi]
MNKNRVITCVVFALISSFKDFSQLCCLYSSEQDAFKEEINKRLYNCNFKNEKDKNIFLFMLHKLEIV